MAQLTISIAPERQKSWEWRTLDWTLNLCYVTLIFISLDSAFHINWTCIKWPPIFMWPYFTVPLEGHIRKVWLYLLQVWLIWGSSPEWVKPKTELIFYAFLQSKHHEEVRLRAKIGWVVIRIMCYSGATCLPVVCCFSERSTCLSVFTTNFDRGRF